MRLRLWIILGVGIALSLALGYLVLLMGCDLGVDIKCFEVAQVEGVVWSTCDYYGNITIEPGLPINWAPINWAGNFKCVAAGRVGNRTYAVFIRSVYFGEPDQSPFQSELTSRCYSLRHGRVIVTVPAVAWSGVAVLVVDVDKGVGYLGLAVGIRNITEIKTWHDLYLSYSDVAFGDGGVYIANRHIWAQRQVAGEKLVGCFYVVKTRVDRDKLILGRPVNRTAGNLLVVKFSP